MTMTKMNNNLTKKELKQKQIYEENLKDPLYLMTHLQYEKLNNILSLYDSLSVLSQPFSGDENLFHFIGLLDHINASFIQEIENLTLIKQ